MKKILWIVVALCMLFLTVACNEKEKDEPDENDRETGIIIPTPVHPSNDRDNDETGQPGEGDPESIIDPPGYIYLGEITATGWAAAVRMGWSLGNTLDAHGNSTGFPLLGGGVYANTTVTVLETGWNRPVTTKAHFTTLKEAGFNAIRIPVTWYKACDVDLNIREDWMARVKEVVGYAVANDMFIILNTHHDNVLFGLHDSDIEESKNNLIKIWEQIADAFKDFDLKLAFEGLNEPRTIGSTEEWRGGTEEERANLNILNQVFVDTVRGTGGNNAERVLIVPTYAASANETAQRGFVLPEDPAIDRLIVSLHYYEPWSFALRTGSGSVKTWSADNEDDTIVITRAIDLAHELFVSKGIPVIIGEMGAINRDNTDARVAWAEFYTSYARSKNIPCFWWDNGSYWVLRRLSWGWEQTFGLLDRENTEIVHRDIVAALIHGTTPGG